jgi:nicotinamide phosphoribosyltransferase
MWKPCTSATIAKEYYQIFYDGAMETVGNADFVPFQGHDFSMRGMSGLQDAKASGAGHLLAFVGTDTIPAVDFLEKYYGANCEEELVGCSVAATEHAVMCSNTGFFIYNKYEGDWERIGDAEYDVFHRLITEVYPNGIVSIVSDTFDLWQVLIKFMAKLKDVIMARDGKVVIRPDSGDPVKILTGYFDNELLGDGSPHVDKDGNYLYIGTPGKTISDAERKGVVELLWDVFGGTMTEKGYRLLDSHVGCIYGDSITMDRAREINSRLKTNGFATINWVAGIGSYTYQYQTRDTFGFAQKSTYCEVILDRKILKIPIFKDPITDDGTKKSARGLIAVYWDEDTQEYYMKDEVSWEEYHSDDMIEVYRDGVLKKEYTLKEVRKNIKNNKLVKLGV